MRSIYLLASFLIVGGCGHRQVSVPSEEQSEEHQEPESTDSEADATQPTRDDANLLWPACSLPPGVHGEGKFENYVPDVDIAAPTFTTERDQIQLTQQMAHHQSSLGLLVRST